MSQTLQCAVERVPQQRVCIADSFGSHTYEDVLTKAKALRERLLMAKGANVALRGLAPVELTLTLIALDGLASQILLLPSSLDTSRAETLTEQSNTHYLLNSGSGSLHEIQQCTGAQPVTTKWLLATSGTTGTPKVIEHRLETLTRSVKSDHEVGASYIWGLMYDPNRFAGLQVILQSLFSGSTIVTTEQPDFESQLDAVLAHPVNGLSATPSLWRKLLMDGRVSNLPLKQVTLGGEIADQPILDALKRRFPKARVVHIYASTEAGTGFSVKDGYAGFPVEWLNNPERVPALKVNADQHLLIKPALMPTGSEIMTRVDGEGYLDTQDLVGIAGDRVLFMGRSSGAINVGGNKVNPEAIEIYLRGLEGVRDARVFGKKSSMMGQLICAQILPMEDIDPKGLRQRVIQSCKKDLESWQVPALINFVEEMKENAAGKRERLSS